MKFTVVLIGQKNVGKSMLFNSLIQKKSALVSHDAGLTRDRKYGNLKIADLNIVVIDTAAIDTFGKKDNFTNEIFKQTVFAIDQSNLICFIVDAKIGLDYNDEFLINWVRKKSIKIFLIINKIDLIENKENILNECYHIGINDVFYISALKNYGLLHLKNAIKNFFEKYVVNTLTIQKNILQEKYDFLSNNLYASNVNLIISIVGKPNVGKSTLLNTLIKQNRSIVSNIPGTTRDSIFGTVQYLNYQYTIFDTAGIKKKNVNSIESCSVMQTLESIANSNILILLISIPEIFSKQDIWILNTIIKSGKPLFILINKSELLTIKEKKEIKIYLYMRYKIIKFFEIHFISALCKIGIKKIFLLIKTTYQNSNKFMRSSFLTKIMNHAVFQRPPELIQGKKIKLKYAHPGGYQPPTIIIHGFRVSSITNNYHRYLENYFQRYLGLRGSIIKIIFKNQNNPYI